MAPVSRRSRLQIPLKPLIFQPSSFQLLKLENSLRWSLFTLSYFSLFLLGSACDKKHILECEEFSTTGKCSKGSKCTLIHRARKNVTARKRKSSSKEENESSKLFKLDFTTDEGFLPLWASDAGFPWYLILSIQMILHTFLRFTNV